MRVTMNCAIVVRLTSSHSCSRYARVNYNFLQYRHSICFKHANSAQCRFAVLFYYQVNRCSRASFSRAVMNDKLKRFCVFMPRDNKIQFTAKTKTSINIACAQISIELVCEQRSRSSHRRIKILSTHSIHVQQKFAFNRIAELFFSRLWYSSARLSVN